jgi:hypothetical protein
MNGRKYSVNEIDTTITIYERVRARRYKVEIIDLGTTFDLVFLPKFYHHLAGFQHLADLSYIASPPNKDRFYRELRKGKIDTDILLRSDFYGYIEERILNFHRIEEMLNHGDLQIIVGYDNGKTNTGQPKMKIEAKYYLYQREGNPLNGEPITYYDLFIGQDAATGAYYPATFIVEHSRLYASGQRFYDCKVTPYASR